MVKFGTHNPNIPQMPVQKSYIFKISLARSLDKII